MSGKRTILVSFQPKRGPIVFPQLTKGWKIFASGFDFNREERDLHFRGPAVSCVKNVRRINAAMRKAMAARKIVSFSVQFSTEFCD
jgi:hypothetical protein